MSLKKLAISTLALFTLGACGTGTNSVTQSSEKSEANSQPKVVKVGLYGEKNEDWDYLKKELKEKENIELELVKFTDYVTPNTALEEGSVDINAFQTVGYLETFNKEHKTHIVPIGWTLLQPLGIYSNKIKNVSELKENDTVIIPDGASNGGRALLLLQEAGLIKVDASKGVLPAISDITENKLNLNIKEVTAAQTIRSLDDAAVAIANGDVAIDAGKSPKQDAIFLEKVTEKSKPYYNFIAAHEKNKDDAVLKTIVKYYQTDAVAKVLEESTKGASIPIWNEAK
ncbi:MetQ/NlpA family ABC transporter substrate-binding protein [Granulicatella sp. zg-ZJ]|uniref:MetQ/NlpA family ABC transporter substrate-binding protein n=1 Tax=Granulicatella sp. zg-ZJ TaxID=2678504 RepID=UPI0013D84CC0|nr:MetQ/NlpA family ABC transporter substrate-binding protein [Granulicatella sp. zg-ZJ]NEW62517.1 MetQ/NlpA family ABC transporter substrate-binding protein [Granulicatella sp. zg-ZJ]